MNQTNETGQIELPELISNLKRIKRKQRNKQKLRPNNYSCISILLDVVGNIRVGVCYDLTKRAIFSNNKTRVVNTNRVPFIYKRITNKIYKQYSISSLNELSNLRIKIQGANTHY